MVKKNLNCMAHKKNIYMGSDRNIEKIDHFFRDIKIIIYFSFLN